MQNGITNRQMFFILLLTLSTFTTIDLPKVIAQTAGTNGWMAILAASLFFGLAAAMITSLNNRFQGKTLYEYGEEIVGKFVSRVIILYYILYFAQVIVNLKIRLAGFLKYNFLPNTPLCLVIAMSVSLFSYISYKGITNAARLLELYGAVFLVTTTVLCIIMIPQGFLYNILPFIDTGEFRYLPESLPHLVIVFGGIEVLMAVPFSQANRKAPRVSFLSILFIGALYVLITESSITILGINNAALYNDAFIEAIKIVEIPVLERPDIFYLTVSLTSLFAGMVMIYIALLEYICKLFPKVRRISLALISGAVLYIACMVLLGSKDMQSILHRMLAITTLLSSVVIPALLLILAKFKAKPKYPR